jgi:hypothetical protein
MSGRSVNLSEFVSNGQPGQKLSKILRMYLLQKWGSCSQSSCWDSRKRARSVPQLEAAADPIIVECTLRSTANSLNERPKQDSLMTHLRCGESPVHRGPVIILRDRTDVTEKTYRACKRKSNQSEEVSNERSDTERGHHRLTDVPSR